MGELVLRKETYVPTRSDFWNDPDLWLGIDDPHKQMCWEPREVDGLVKIAAAGGGGGVATYGYGQCLHTNRPDLLGNYQSPMAQYQQSVLSKYAGQLDNYAFSNRPRIIAGSLF